MRQETHFTQLQQPLLVSQRGILSVMTGMMHVVCYDDDEDVSAISYPVYDTDGVCMLDKLDNPYMVRLGYKGDVLFLGECDVQDCLIDSYENVYNHLRQIRRFGIGILSPAVEGVCRLVLSLERENGFYVVSSCFEDGSDLWLHTFISELDNTWEEVKSFVGEYRRFFPDIRQLKMEVRSDHPSDADAFRNLVGMDPDFGTVYMLNA